MNIIFEGLPSSGKTSVLHKLKDSFNNAIYVDENIIPNFDYKKAKEEDYIINDQLKSEIIKNNKDNILFCDRYYYSTIIFDCVSNNKKICKDSIYKTYFSMYENRLYIPDLIIYFKQNSDLSYNRILKNPRYLEIDGWWLDRTFLSNMEKWYDFLYNNSFFNYCKVISVNSADMSVYQIVNLMKSLLFDKCI